MRPFYYTFHVLILFVFTSSFLFAQGPDCSEALVICSDGAQVFNPSGPGMNDFANPNNNNGCLLSLEDQSAWYYFEFQPDMPPNSVIEFSLNPDGGFGEDYDFAIFGPNVTCDNLGSPLRCSYASSACAFCPQTGLGNGATDNSEGAGGDGFVAPIVVNPGEGYFLLVDNWLGSSTGFSLNWGGSAAPFLNCSANPTCEMELTMPPDQTACAGGAPVTLFPVVTGNTGPVFYSWDSPTGLGFMDNPLSPSPTITIPDGTAPGTYVYTLTVTDDLCDVSGTVTITVAAAMPPDIQGNPYFCTGSSTTLVAIGNYTSYSWSNGATTSEVVIDLPGTYTVTVTDPNGCIAEASVTITEQPAPEPFVTGEMAMCPEGTATFAVFSPGATGYQWSNGQTTPEITVNLPGPYFVTVTDALGCEGVANWVVSLNESPVFNISGDQFICPGEATILTVDGFFDSYFWSTNEDSQSITVTEGGDYSVTVVDANGCIGAQTYSVFEVPPPVPIITGETTICSGDATALDAGSGFSSYTWQDGSTDQLLVVDEGGIYSVTVLNSDGCVGTAQVEVIETIIETPAITGDSTLCANTTGQLTASGGYTTYLWNIGATTPTIDIDSTGTYQLTVTNAAGCETTAMIDILPNPEPVPAISGDTIFCAGESIVLDAGAGFSSYLWSDGSTNSTITVDTSGTQSVTVTNAEGCTASSQIEVTEIANPTATIDGDTAICDGDTTALSAVGSFASYLWSTGDTTQQINVATPGDITLTVQNAEGCQDETTITISPLTTPTPSISGTLEFCEGQNTTLDADPGYASYLWSNGSTIPSITVATSDTLTITVTNTDGCTASTSAIVVENPNPVPIITGNLSICDGASAVLNAGDGYASYSWSNGATVQEITVDVEAIYSVTVIDDNGCEGSTTHEVTVNESPVPIISGTTDICPGTMTMLDVGNSYVDYLWSDGSTDPFLNTSTTGNVSVTVTDANGCQGTATTTITELPVPSPTITGELEYCSGAATLLSVGTYASYAWSDGSSDQNLSVNMPGQYEVTVTDANGCQGTDVVSITENPLPTVAIGGGLTFCADSNTTLDAGAGFSSYLWNDGTTNQTIIADDMGTYTVTVTDANGCENTDAVTTTVNALPTPSISGNLSFCDGLNTTLNADTGYTSYLWDDGSQGLSITVDATNTYGLTVTDANGCVGTTSVDVEELALPEPMIGGVPSLCDGESTTLNTTESFSMYTWSTTSNAPSILVEDPNIYSVTVTDANGCQGETSLDVQFNDLPVVTISGIDQFCEGESSTLSPDNSFTAYLWSDGSTTSTLEVTQAGTYSVTVTDTNGCQNEDDITISVDPTPQPVIDGTFAFCEDTSSVLSASPGFATYTWEDGSTNTTLEVNTTGTYGLSVTDTNGCQGETAVDITAFALPAPIIGGVPSLCDGESTTLDVGDNYSAYLWSTSSTDPTILVETPDVYSVTVTDANGCQGETSLDVPFNPLPIVSITGIDQFCDGASSTLGTNADFSAYQWSDGSTDATLNVTAANTYSVTVTDDNGCQNEADIDVIVDPLPEPVINGTFDFCADTTSILSVNNSYPGYSWSTGSTNSTIEVGATDAYSLTVTDINGCQGETAVNIEVFDLPTPTIAGEPQFCEGLSTGLTAEGGTFDYLWSTNAQTQSITVDMPGTFTVTVTDSNGCQEVASLEVQENPLPVVDINGIDQFCEGQNSTLDAGSGFETYQWSDGSTAPTLEVTTANTYSVTVTDTNGCENEDAIDIIVNALPAPIIDGTLAFCVDTNSVLSTNINYSAYLWSDGSTNGTLQVDAPGNYALTVTDINGCQGETAVNIEVFDLPTPTIAGEPQFCEGLSTGLSVEGGTFDYLWSTNAQTQDIVVDMPGTFTVTVTDANGCQQETSLEVQENPLPFVDINGVDQFCDGQSSILDAGSGFATYQWSDGSASSSLEVTAADTYSVTVTDANGCENEDAVDITVNSLPTPVIDGTFAFCADTNSVLSTTLNYTTYSWSDGSANGSLQVDTPGSYAVTVTDANGCQGETAVDITVFSLPTPSIMGVLEYCEGLSTTLTAEGDSFDYQWSTNAQTQDIVVDMPGTVSVTVTDGNGCTAETAIEVIEHPLPTPVISGTPSFCAGTSTTLTANSGYVDYQWSSMATGPTLPVETEGTYEVIVTDANGCVNNTSVFVEELPLPEFSISGQTYFCENDQTVVSVPTGFAGYSWSDGTPTPDLAVNAPGNYEVTVTNEFGCTSADAIDIEEILLPVADAGIADIITCAFPTLTLGGDNPYTGNTYEYIWTGPGITPANMNQQEPIINEPGTYTLTIIDTEYNCSSIPSTVDIDQNTDLPVVILEVLDTLDCTTSTVLIDGTASSSGDNFSYQWFVGGSEIIPGATTNTLLVNEPALYGLQIIDSENGCEATGNIPVVENVLYPIANAGQPMHLDCNVTEASLDASGSEVGDNIRYTWTTPDGNILFGGDSTNPVINEPGLYILLVEDILNDCANRDTVVVTQDIVYPIAEAGNTQELDCNTPTVTLDGTGSSVGPDITYNWSASANPTFSSAERIVSVDQPGTYTIVVTNTENGCATTDEVIITENAAEPTGMILEGDSPTCFGDSDGSVVVSVTVGGTPPFMYSLNGGPYGSSAVFSGLEGGVYEVTVQDLTGCEYSEQITVLDGNDLSLNLGDDHFIDLGESATIQAQATIPFEELNDITWNAADSLDCIIGCEEQTVRPFRTTDYTATVVDENGCVAEDEVTVFVNRPYDVFVPNAFSPNNDGNNDKLVVFAGEDVAKINSFQIFSRWGETIFEVYNFLPNDPTYGWDGTHRAQEMNSAVFVYMVEVEFIDGEVVLFKGDVILMR